MSAPPHAPGRYDNVALSVHWLIAALAIAVAVLGLMIPEAPRGSAWRELVLMLHRSIGLSILVVTLFWTLWRLSHPAPPLPASLRPIEVFLARATHFLLYVAFLAMPLSGYVDAAASGYSVSLFGIVAIPPLIGENARLAQIAIALHLAGQFAVYVLVAMHIAAALMHGIVRRDGVFSRMLPGRRGG